MLVLFSACGSNSSDEELPGTFTVDLERYAGLWYEAARMPNRFQKDCICTSARYVMKKNSNVKVINTCTTSNEEVKQSEGTAKIAHNSKDNRKLKVTFFWPFYGKYWIVHLSDDYRYAVISGPSRKYGWILARELPVKTEKMNELLSIAQEWGLNTEKLIYSNTTGCSEKENLK
jgi:apolipoprotein D and lipocalin family protein